MVMTCDRVRELASGFVLGALDTDEMIAVSDHLDGCRKPHPEVQDLGGVLPYIAESLEPVEPPAWLRESVIAAAKADLVARRRVGKPSEHRTVEPVEAPAVLPVAATSHADVISLAAVRNSRRRRAVTWAMRAAAAVAIVVLSGYSFNLQNQLSKAQQLNNARASQLYYQAQFGTRSAVLFPTDGTAASGQATLMPTGHVILVVAGLAPTKDNQVYVVWLNSGEGSPSGGWTKAGSLRVDESGQGFLMVDNVPTAGNLWLYICREANAGVTQPTGPRVLNGTIWL
jgi:Putative zinc-finger